MQHFFQRFLNGSLGPHVSGSTLVILQQNVSVRNFLSDECKHMWTRLLSSHCTTVGGNGAGCGVSTHLRSNSTFQETSHTLGLFTIRWFYSQFCCIPMCIIQVHMTV